MCLFIKDIYIIRFKASYKPQNRIKNISWVFAHEIKNKRSESLIRAQQELVRSDMPVLHQQYLQR